MKVFIGGYPDYKYWLDRLFGWNPKQKISVRIDDANWFQVMMGSDGALRKQWLTGQKPEGIL